MNSAMTMTGMKLFGWMVLAALAPGLAWAQARQVTVIIPYGPGGNYDQTARLLANLVKPHTSEPWIVVNRPGATGTIGVTEAMRAKPDGKTIVLTGFGDQARLMVEEEEAKYRAIAPMLQAYIKVNPAGR